MVFVTEVAECGWKVCGLSLGLLSGKGSISNTRSPQYGALLEIVMALKIIYKIKMRNLLLVLVLFCIIGCQNKTVEKDGGLVIDLRFSNESLSDQKRKMAVEIVKERAINLSKSTPIATFSDSLIRLELPEEYDSILYMKMLPLNGSFEINRAYVLPDLIEYLTKINDEIYLKDTTNLFSVLSLNVNDDQVPANEPILGFALTSDTSSVINLLSSQKAKALLPENINFRWDLLESFQSFALYAVAASPVVTRNMLIIPESRKNPIVKLKKEYFESWRIFTSNNVGSYAAISIDNQVFSWPVIDVEVGDGLIYQPHGSFINDKIWSYVLPILMTDLLKAELEIQKIKYIQPKDSQH
jgi:preprotein translocase subunit SecD